MTRVPFLLIPLLILGAVLLAFFPALSAGYIWDDDAVFQNPLVLQADGLWKIWFHPAANTRETHYWPLVYSVFWLQQRAWGGGAFGHHLVNVLFHAGNAVLIWAFLRREQLPAALWVSLAFALHPTKVESVAWVIELKDVLSGFFYLLAFWAGVRTARSSGPDFWRGIALCGGLFLCSLLSKSAAVTLPAGILIYLWWRSDGAPGRRSLVLAAVLSLIALLVTTFDLWLNHQMDRHGLWLSPQNKGLIAGRALWFYFEKLLLPTGLSAIYPYDLTCLHPQLSTEYFYPLGAAVGLLLLWLLRREVGRGPFAAALYFAVTLSPMLGFITFSYMMQSLVADRFLYLAGLSIFLAAGVTAAGLIGRLPRLAGAVVAGFGWSVIVLLGALTWIRCEVFRSPETLFMDVIRTNPRAVAAHINLGDVALFRGKTGEAAGHYSDALEQAPEYVAGRVKYAQVLLMQGKHAEAVRQCRIALRLEPDAPAARMLIAAALQQEASGGSAAPVTRPDNQ